MPELAEKLLELAINGKNWEKWPTELRGVFLIRPPSRKSQDPSLIVAINPVDESGSPIKKRDYFIRDKNDLFALRKVMNDERLEKLLDALEEVFPSGKKGKSSSEVIKI